MEQDQGQEREQLWGQKQEREEVRWSDKGAAEEFWSVKVSVLFLDAGNNCVSGLHSCFVPKGLDDAGRSCGAVCSLIESFEFFESFC